MLPLEVPLTLRFGCWLRGASLAERPGICYNGRMFKYIKALIFLVPFLSVAGFAAAETTLQKVSKKYRNAKLVEMSVEKTVTSELLGKETKYQGKIFLANKKFRWENTTPEKTLLVFDGTTIYSEQTPPKELGGVVQVAKGKVDKKTGSHILISSLLGADLEKNFKAVEKEKVENLVKYDVTPVSNDLSIKDLKIVLDSKELTMKELSYKDDIGNLTVMRFSNVNLPKKEKNSLFKYVIPKGAQVTDL